MDRERDCEDSVSPMIFQQDPRSKFPKKLSGTGVPVKAVTADPRLGRPCEED